MSRIPDVIESKVDLTYKKRDKRVCDFCTQHGNPCYGTVNDEQRDICVPCIRRLSDALNKAGKSK